MNSTLESNTDMNVQAKSDHVRRSERLKNKLTAKDARSEGQATKTRPNVHGNEVTIIEAAPFKTTKSRSSQASKIRRAEIEFAIKKKQLEQEMLDLELALRLEDIGDESGSDGESESLIHESDKPNMEKWIQGQVPWDYRLNENKCNTKSVESDTKVRNDIHSIDMKSQVNLPQISKILTRQSLPRDLPNFDGSPLEWPNFIHQYNNSNALCGYTDEENQVRLQKCLKGNARKVVRSLLIMPQNVNNVMKLLESRFGRPEQIIMLLLNDIKKLPQIREDKLGMFIEFSDEVKNFVATIESLQEEDHLHNPLLLNELLLKLPVSYQLSWTEHISKMQNPKFKLTEFSKWLDEKATTASYVQSMKCDNYSCQTDNSKFKTTKKTVSLATTNNDSKIARKCQYCNEDFHTLTGCTKFKALSTDERWSFITIKKICFSCLKPSHNIRQCRNRKSCGINQCTKPHNALLHKEYPANDKNNVTENNSNDSIERSQISCHIGTDKNVLLKILPVVINTGHAQFDTYALLDDASTVTLIDQELADRMNLSGPLQPLCLQWANEDEVHQQNDSRVVSFTISNRRGNRNFQVRHVRTTRLSLPYQTIDLEAIRCKYPYIDDRISTFKNAQPKIIIGQDNWHLLVTRKLINGSWNGPAMSKTLLGWVLHGNLECSGRKSFVCHTSIRDGREKDDLDILHDMVKEYWKLEAVLFPSEKVLSPEDRRAQKILDETMKRVGKRYETGLLWKNENIVLPESKMNALRRLECTERKMDKNSDYGKMYCNKIFDLEKKGYIRKLSEDDAKTTTNKTWYLPHFGIQNPNKPNKLRIVFDASSKSSGVSLNDCLISGPDLYNSLYTILLNFRIKKFAFTADIKEMFLQVLVRKEDCCAQRILWRGMDRHRNPDVYEISVVFFGSTCGPCLAQEAKNRNAMCFVDKYPEATKAILEHHYMDDYLGGADTLLQAKQLIREVIFVHQQGGFIICNWIANNKKILEDVHEELISEGAKNLETNVDLGTERILGVFWNPEKDTFEFKTKFHKIPEDVLENRRRPTKREVLKVVMSIFDPIGFLANFVIQGKVLLQDIWHTQIGWDDELPNSLYENWQIWLNDLKNIFSFTVPRQYFTLDRQECDIQLHIFCDASEKCYATVAYFRINRNGEIQTSFVGARTRVAPLKQPVSIPRLELQAALMGARLGHTLKNSLELNISNIFYWSDSKTVLHWIRSEARRFKVFVSQRLGEIQELTNVADWRYVNTRENVADEATKRKGRFTFSEGGRWISGPNFLLSSPKDWPKEENQVADIDADLLEYKKQEIVLLSCDKKIIITPDPNRFSKWTRLVRATTYVLRFIENLKNGTRNGGELTVEEINMAENLLYRKIQMDSFCSEMNLLKTKKPLSPQSRLYTLSCIYSEDDNLLRLGGRLNNALVCENMKKPIILDPGHRITKLLIENYHQNAHHHGQETVINELRQKFWILRIRQAVKSAWNSCQHCKNRRAVPQIPVMGQLPICRLEPTIRPFIKTGMDFFGPLEVPVKRSREKRYGVIFICMVTRAVHLDIAHDLSTNSFINILRQFGCRRGFPEELFSDNGQNFRGAEREISECLQDLQQDEVMKFCTMKKIKWNFNPPLAPHMGGNWERLIQSTKKVLKEMLTSRYPSEDVLRTFLIETENILNSRPLTHVSLDCDSAEALTPNHFLIGPQYASFPCTKTDEKDLNLMKSWRAAQRLADLFWTRWTQEYLPTLIRRTKWFSDRRNIQMGDVVILVNPNGPRNLWQKGIVIALYPAKDGHVRVVDVETTTGVFRRPVSKLIVLDVRE